MRQWVLTLGLAFLLAAVPLAKGGMVAEVRLALVAGGAGLAALAVLAVALTQHRTRQRDWSWCLPWFAVAVWVGVQIAAGWWELAPFGYPFDGRSGTSFDLATAASWWAVFTAYAGIAWVASRLDRVHVRVLLTVILGLAAFESLYGLVAWAQRSEFVLGVYEWPRARPANLSGTFINRNHFASLLALCWPLILAFLLARRHQGGISIPAPMRYGLAVMLSLVIGLALFSSQSRLGVAAALLGLAVYALAWGRITATDERNRPWWMMPLAVLVAVVGGLWFGLAPLLERYLAVTEDVSRLQVWAASFALPWQVWVFGAGPGGFEDVFVTVQPGEVHNRYLYMHNDWLQFVLEMGIVGTIIIGAAFVYWLKSVWTGKPGLVQCGALAGVVAVSVHALGDFPLHIPGVAVVFWVAVGLLMNRHLTRKQA